MSDLALALYAAVTGAHVVAPPRDARFGAFLAAFDERAERARLGRIGVRFLGRSEPGFPRLLGAVHDPPPGLFVRGDAPFELLCRSAVAIVGARSCSGYGRAVAQTLGRELAAAGLVVVSGLARGIDGEAHRGALAADGLTVAVLGCGIDRDYPAAHAELARQIAATGLVVSEYAPGIEPAPWRFPARNRIVAGLCAATVVVEARERSGALITADFALEEGREVFAVPGEITSALSAGTNGLLRLGATPLLAVSDVLAPLGVASDEAGQPGGVRPGASRSLEGAAAVVFACLRDGPAGADELVRRTGMPAAEVAAALTELELAGLVGDEEGVFRSSIVT